MSELKSADSTSPVASVPDAGETPPTTAADLYVRPTGHGDETAVSEREHAKHLAERYRLQYVDMAHFYIDQELFRSIPADLMLRYGFVPHRREGQSLVIVVSDPTDLPKLDELALLLGSPIKVTVGTLTAIESILKKSEGSQRGPRRGHGEL